MAPKPQPVGRLKRSKGDSRGGAGPNAATLRRLLLGLWQQKDRCTQASPESLAELRESLTAVGRSCEPFDGALLGMACAQCSRRRDARPVSLLCNFAMSRLELCGGRAVVEMAQAARNLGCLEPGFLGAVLAFFATGKPGSFESLRDAAGAARILLQSLREDACAFADAEGAARGLMEIGQERLRGARGTPGNSVRDAVEFVHACAHIVAGQRLTFNKEELQTNEAALHDVFIFICQELHMGSARDVAMMAGAAAAVWQELPGLRPLLQTCLEDVAQAARFKFSEFNSQDLAEVAAAFAKMRLPSEIFGSVLDLRMDSESMLPNRDLCFLLWAAARVPGWGQRRFAALAVASIAAQDSAKISTQDLCTVVQSLMKLPELPGALHLASSLCEVGLSRPLLEKDRRCLLRALQQHFPEEDAASFRLPPGLHFQVQDGCRDDVAGYPASSGMFATELDLPRHTGCEGHGHGHGHSHGHGSSHGSGHHHDETHCHHGCHHNHAGHQHEEGSGRETFWTDGDHFHRRPSPCGTQSDLWDVSTNEEPLNSCQNESCCPSFHDDSSQYRLNTHCSFDGHCIQMKNTFIHIPCSSFSDSENEECVVCSFKRSRSFDTSL